MVINSISNLELILAISELITLILELILTQIWVSIGSSSISEYYQILANVSHTRANTPTSVRFVALLGLNKGGAATAWHPQRRILLVEAGTTAQHTCDMGHRRVAIWHRIVGGSCCTTVSSRST
eukprot:563398-Prymnesium_polylepis.1